MGEMSLKEAFNLAKHKYYRKSMDTYLVEKDGEYYCRVKTEKEAQRLTFYLKRIGFRKENLEEALKELNIEKCKKKRSASNTGFYGTSRWKDNRYKTGYKYAYRYVEDGKPKYITAITLSKLRKKVLSKGLKWYPITEEAKKLEEEME